MHRALVCKLLLFSALRVSAIVNQIHQSSNVTNPVLAILKSGALLAPGYMFFVPEIDPETAFTPLIMSDDGDLIWSSVPEASFNLHVTVLNGKNVLSYWIGYLASIGYGYGAVKILDDTYTELYTICPKLGLHVPHFDVGQPMIECDGDIHESEITSDATLLVSVYNVTRHNLTSIGGGAAAWTVDSQFREIDIVTGEILFTWKSLDHVPLSNTIIPLGLDGNFGDTDTTPFDFFHINSVQKVAEGRYLVGSRHTSAIYMIDTDGSIMWTFNGYNGGDFTLPKAPHNLTHFGYQHYARMESISPDIIIVHFFNNNNIEDEATTQPSSGMKYRLNTSTKKATLLRRFHDPNQPFQSLAQGSYLRLTNGNVFIGFGQLSYLKEFGPSNDTDVRMTVQFGDGDANYRVYKQGWHATPAGVPDVALVLSQGLGFVSWNGATDVSSYGIYAGATKTSLLMVTSVNWTGFETQFHLPNGTSEGGFIQVGAFRGNDLVRRSAVVPVKQLK